MWTKDEIPIENTRISYQFDDLWNRTLILKSSNLTYTGIYACHVDLRSGGFPTIIANASIEVYGKHFITIMYEKIIASGIYKYLTLIFTFSVTEKPSFINELKRETLSEYGSTVTLPCEAEGVPLPKISWYRNAESVDHFLGTRCEKRQKIVSI